MFDQTLATIHFAPENIAEKKPYMVRIAELASII